MIVKTLLIAAIVALFHVTPAFAQLTDTTQTPNVENEGVHKSLTQQIGAGRGSAHHAGLLALHHRARSVPLDPARPAAVPAQVHDRAGRRAARHADGIHDDINGDPSPGAGLVDSCAGCHGRPRGSAGFGGDVFTRPDSRDAPHLFGLGLVEMLADEMTTDLRTIRSDAIRTGQTRSAQRDADARRARERASAGSPRARTEPSTRSACRASTRICACGRSSLTAASSRSAASRSARSTTRWASSRPIADLRVASAGRTRRHACGHRARRKPGSDPGARHAQRDRGRRRRRQGERDADGARSTTWSSTC